MPSARKRSSNSRIWNEARTSTAICANSAGSCCADFRLRKRRCALLLPRPTRLSPEPSRRRIAFRSKESCPGARDWRQSGQTRRPGWWRSSGNCVPDGSLWRREIAFETQDVFHFRAAPGIDRLIVIADHAEIAIFAREQPQPEILRDIGVLIFVHQDEAEAVAVILQNFRVRSAGSRSAPAADRRNRRRSAISAAPDTADRARGPCRWQSSANHPREFRPDASPRFFQPSISRASVRAGQRFSSMFSGLDDLFHEPQLIVLIEDGEIRFQPGQFGMVRRMRAPMEWKVPSHCMPSTVPPIKATDALLHLARRLVGEGDGENLVWPGAAGGQDMRQPDRQTRASCRCRRRPAPAPDHPAPARLRAVRHSARADMAVRPRRAAVAGAAASPKAASNGSAKGSEDIIEFLNDSLATAR